MLTGGSVMIGSLYWEDEHNAPGAQLGRLKRLWRQELDLSRQAFCPAPIRYGMQSARRWDTYTMVFSATAPVGQGVRAPFRASVGSADALLAQARRLGKAEGYAEGGATDPLYSAWGLVAVVWHPRHQAGTNPWKNAWRSAFADFGHHHQYRTGDETPCVNEWGEFTLPLPVPNDLDYLLVTPNVPNVCAYPGPAELARAIRESTTGYDTYLRKNIHYGLRATGDQEALSWLF